MNKASPHLNTLVATIQPKLYPEEYFFCAITAEQRKALRDQPIFEFHETDAVTVVLRREELISEYVDGQALLKMIQVNVPGTIVAAGVFVIIATRLAAHGIDSKPVTAFHHAYLFVPSARAEESIRILEDLEDEYRPEEVIQQGSHILM